MKKLAWRWLALGLGIYGLALVCSAPATLLDVGLRNASEGRLRIVQAQGTLWAGNGQLEFRDARGRSGLAIPLAWRLQPSQLLRAHLAYQVELEPGSRPFPVKIYWSRIELANTDVRLPAAALAYLVPKLAPLGLGGEVNLLIPALSIGRRASVGSATLQWHAASSALSPVTPLGDFQLQLEGNGPQIQAHLSTLQGPLQISGQGAWTSNHKPTFLANIQVPSALQQRLAPFLRLITVERGDGSFQWQLN